MFENFLDIYYNIKSMKIEKLPDIGFNLKVSTYVRSPTSCEVRGLR